MIRSFAINLTGSSGLRGWVYVRAGEYEGYEQEAAVIVRRKRRG